MECFLRSHQHRPLPFPPSSVCGVHRCYLDDCGCGILYLCTGGCMFIGVLIDCCSAFARRSGGCMARSDAPSLPQRSLASWQLLTRSTNLAAGASTSCCKTTSLGPRSPTTYQIRAATKACPSSRSTLLSTRSRPRSSTSLRRLRSSRSTRPHRRSTCQAHPRRLLPSAPRAARAQNWVPASARAAARRSERGSRPCVIFSVECISG